MSMSSRPGPEFAGVVIAQCAGRQMLQERRAHDERAFGLRHFLAADGEEPVDVDLRRQIAAGRLQHAGPEQRVKVRDVLADEMMNFGLRVAAPPVVQVLAVPSAPLPASMPCSRSARRTRRTSSGPVCPESQNQNTAPVATRPSRAAVRQENVL